MKVTKYPHRYTISLSEAEMALLRETVDHGLSNLFDVGQSDALEAPLRRLLKSDRWRAITGPLTVDEEKPGRGGYARMEAAQ